MRIINAGHQLTERGPSPAVSGVIGGCVEIYTSIGRTKAAVLPEPVWATPTTSRFMRPRGIHCISAVRGRCVLACIVCVLLCVCVCVCVCVCARARASVHICLQCAH